MSPDIAPNVVDLPRSAGQDSDEIGAFIRARLARLSARVSHRHPSIDEDAIREVRFLHELMLVVRAQHGRHKTKLRSMVPWLVAVTVVTVTALVFLRLPAIRVDLDLLSSGVTFRTLSPVQLTGLSRLMLLQASELAPADIEDPATLQLTTLAAPIELRPDREGALTLSSISIPADAVVSIFRTADAGTWRLDIEHEAASVAATASGPVQIAGRGTSARTMSFGRGSRIDLRANRSAAPRLGLFLTPERVDTLLVASLIPVQNIVFKELLQEGSSSGQGILRGETSSVLAGSIFNVSLGGKELSLRKRDSLDLTVATAHVRELVLERDGLRMSVSAVASELRVGREGGLQTLRPSWLEWLAERHGLKLAWGCAAWVFGLLLGGVKWWQESRA